MRDTTRPERRPRPATNGPPVSALATSANPTTIPYVLAVGSLDPTAVEASLAAYYDTEGDDRLHQPIEPRRLAMRGAFLESLSEGRRHILEIGAGPGRDAGAFIEAGHHFFAVDLSMQHARRCRSTGAHVVRATVRRLPFRRASFDSIWTMSTLMHVPDSAIVSALAEVSRVLKPGGAAAIGVWGGPDVEDYTGVPQLMG